MSSDKFHQVKHAQSTSWSLSCQFLSRCWHLYYQVWRVCAEHFVGKDCNKAILHPITWGVRNFNFAILAIAHGNSCSIFAYLVFLLTCLLLFASNIFSSFSFPFSTFSLASFPLFSKIASQVGDFDYNSFGDRECFTFALGCKFNLNGKGNEGQMSWSRKCELRSMVKTSLWCVIVCVNEHRYRLFWWTRTIGFHKLMLTKSPILFRTYSWHQPVRNQMSLYDLCNLSL